MKKITYVLRPYIHKSGRVMVRVRWNHSKNETVFSIGCSAEHEKWSKEANRAKINTTHIVNGIAISAKEINARIENVHDVVGRVSDYIFPSNHECHNNGVCPIVTRPDTYISSKHFC